MQQARLAQVALAKQTAFGALPANAQYVQGVAEGAVIKTDVTENSVDVAWSNRIEAGYDRTLVVPGAEYTTVATPSAIGLALAACLGADAVTGAGPTYTHTITPAASPYWMTVWGSYAGLYYQLENSFVDTLEFSWDRAGALRVKKTVLSQGFAALGSTGWTGGVSESPAQGNFFTGAGGTFTLGADTQANLLVQSGTITIANKSVAVPASYQVSPVSLMPGTMSVTYSLKCVPVDDRLWREMLTGTAGGSLIATSPFLGQLTSLFQGPGSDTLQFSVPSSKFAVAFPDVKLEGGPAEYTVEGVMVAPASGAAMTAALVNTVTAAY